MRNRKKARNPEAGMTLVELLIAMLVLAVGMAGVLLMITSGIASNNRNRIDTGATTISQMVMESLLARPAGDNGLITLRDCRPAAQGGPQNLQLNTTGAAQAAGGMGAQINDPVAGGNGDINWLQAPGAVPAGYRIVYFACGTVGREVSYEVRVNVISPAINVAGAPSKIFTVSTRKAGDAAAVSNLANFAPPATLRSFAGR